MHFEPVWMSTRGVFWLTATLLGGILSCVVSSSTLSAQESRIEVVKRWDFGNADDIKGSGWPDHWVRVTGRDYPKYLSIRIARSAATPEELHEIDKLRRIYGQAKLAWEKKAAPWNITPERIPRELDNLLEATILNPYLEFEMDGGRAEVNSPFISIENESVYGISCNILADCESREFEAMATLKLCDANRNVLLEQTTQPVTGQTNWDSMTADTQYVYNPGIVFAQVSLKVVPRVPQAYRGRFCFDAVRITRAPRLALQVNKDSKIYREGETIIAECSAIGMATLQSSVDLLLQDHNGTIIAQSRRTLERETSSTSSPPKYVSETPNKKPKEQSYWNGHTKWTLPKLAPGYYEVHTQLERMDRRNALLKQSFVVLATEQQFVVNPHVGWSILEDQNPREQLTNEQLIDLLREACVGKIKLPIWGDPHDHSAFEATMQRIDRLQGAGITCVGVIATPPPKLRTLFQLARGAETGSFLEDWTVAQSLLEPVIRETSVRILHYQIGWDNEVDFVSNARVLSSIESLRRLLHRYGQESHLIASRNPLNSANDNKLIDRWQLTSSIPFTAEEQSHLLSAQALSSGNRAMPWFHITPLPSDRYSTEARVQDLAERMLLLTDQRIQAGSVGWVFDPSSQQANVYSLNSGPGIMFVPFRTLAGTLAGMTQVGSLSSTVLGRNLVLSSGDDCKIVAWSSNPFTAELFVGNRVTAYDIWGRIVPINSVKTENGTMQQIPLSEWPIVLQGVDLKAIRWRMGMEILTKKLDVVVGKVDTIEIRFDNPMPHPAIGRVQLKCSALEANDELETFQIEAVSSEIIKVPVRIRPEANVGPTTIEAKFYIDDVPIVLKDVIQIGNDEFDFNLQYRFDEENQLLVEVEAINKTGSPASFDCILRIAGRRSERRQILGLVNKTKRTFVLPDADNLVGKVLRLQCEQEATNRVINKQIEIKRPQNLGSD